MSLPVVVLIEEHKLVIKAVDIIKAKIAQINVIQTVNPTDISILVDFFRAYADRFHHGKEEGILFRELSGRNLKDDDKKIMNELIMEHAFARRTVTALENARESYVSGKTESLSAIQELLQTLANLYPAQIEKEDKRFFYPSMEYFGSQELEAMQRKFEEFNRTFTDKRYIQIIGLLAIS